MRHKMKTEKDEFWMLRELLSGRPAPPPPRDLPNGVIQGIRNPKPQAPLPWWRHLQLAVMESRPVQLAILGLAVGGLLLAALASSRSLEQSGKTATFNDRSSLLAAQGTNAPVVNLSPDADRTDLEIHASTEPVLGTNLSAFRFNTLGPRAEPISFTPRKN
jgi:hypothetical protein